MTVPVIRPATIEDALAMAHVHVSTWRTTYTGIVPAEHLANLSYERCQAGWIEHIQNQSGKEYTFVAEDQPGQIVAIASGGPLREAMAGFDGELYVLYVLKSFQGMGYGKQLVTQVAQTLISTGYHSMIIWVLKDNPACHFYARLGGQPIAEKVVEIGGKQLTDVAYAWRDLDGFKHPVVSY
jgi:GNAT superfamily N-acetyltransferase